MGLHKIRFLVFPRVLEAKEDSAVLLCAVHQEEPKKLPECERECIVDEGGR